MEKEQVIKALFRYPQKRVPGLAEEELILVEEAGIEGDCHADGGDRQISLLTVQEKEWMQKQERKGFCFQKYKENILLDGISLSKCNPGDVLICGEAVMELTDSMKRCYPQCCKLISEEGRCLLAGSLRFARVKKGGSIRLGMKISLGNDEKIKEEDMGTSRCEEDPERCFTFL